MSPVATTLLVVVFLVISVTMILIVLVQRPQGGGLSGAFGAGGDGAGQTAFGTKTGDVLTWATIGIFVMFVVFAVVLNFATRPGEPKDNTPSIVAPGTPRETVDDTETEDAADDSSQVQGDESDAASAAPDPEQGSETESDPEQEPSPEPSGG